MRVKHHGEIEEVQIASWRRQRLVEAGFPGPLAERLAGDERYDLHSLIELTERGCSAVLAARILAPLGDSASAA